MEVLTALDRDRIAGLLQRDEFFWLDLHSPPADDLAPLADLLGLHPVAIDLLGSFRERPRLDDYETYVVLVFYGVGGEGREPLKPIEVHMLISGSYIVTVHREPCDVLDRLRGRFAGGPEGSEGFIVYKVLDALADSFFPALAVVDEDIDALEDAVVTHADEQQLQRIFELKKELVRLRRIVTPQRDLLARTIEEISDLSGFEAGERITSADLRDRLLRPELRLDGGPRRHLRGVCVPGDRWSRGHDRGPADAVLARRLHRTP